MIIHINGKESRVESNLSVSELLEELGIRPGRVVVELNAEVVSRDVYGATQLQKGDEVEIVQFVGGG